MVVVVALRVSCAHHLCTTCGVRVGVIAPCVGHHCCLCAMCGVAAMVVAPRVGRRCHFCAACGVGVGVVAPHAGRCCCFCAACGVGVGVIAPHAGRHCCLCTACGVVVVVIVPHGCWVSQLQSLHCMGVAVMVVVLCGVSVVVAVIVPRCHGPSHPWTTPARSTHFRILLTLKLPFSILLASNWLWLNQGSSVIDSS